MQSVGAEWRDGPLSSAVSWQRQNPPVVNGADTHTHMHADPLTRRPDSGFLEIAFISCVSFFFIATMEDWGEGGSAYPAKNQGLACSNTSANNQEQIKIR